MSNYTRIAATLGMQSGDNNVYHQNYFLNGRRSYQPGRSGYVEITADRAGFGAVYALYQTLNDPSDREPSDRMEDLRVQMDTPGRHRIDNSINELAEAATIASGSSDDLENRSWFSGVIIRNSELVAVSRGPAVAYLYRGDALIPLTADELEWPAKDVFGNVIKDYTIYQAGQSGQVRYSNITTLRRDDCIILAPHDAMSTLGQRELLRLLEEAEDQEQAVQLMLDRMKGNSEASSSSVMMLFVEHIYEGRSDRRGRYPRRESVERDLFVMESTVGRREVKANKHAAPNDSREAEGHPLADKLPLSTFRKRIQLAPVVPEQRDNDPVTDKPVTEEHVTDKPGTEEHVTEERPLPAAEQYRRPSASKRNGSPKQELPLHDTLNQVMTQRGLQKQEEPKRLDEASILEEPDLPVAVGAEPEELKPQLSSMDTAEAPLIHSSHLTADSGPAALDNRDNEDDDDYHEDNMADEAQASYDDEKIEESEDLTERELEETPVDKRSFAYLWPLIMIVVLVVLIILLIWQLLNRLNFFGSPEATVAPAAQWFTEHISRFL